MNDATRTSACSTWNMRWSVRVVQVRSLFRAFDDGIAPRLQRIRQGGAQGVGLVHIEPEPEYDAGRKIEGDFDFARLGADRVPPDGGRVGRNDFGHQTFRALHGTGAGDSRLTSFSVSVILEAWKQCNLKNSDPSLVAT